MVLDIELFRKERGGDPDKIRENAKKRFDSVEAVEEVIRLGKAFWLTKAITKNRNPMNGNPTNGYPVNGNPMKIDRN